MKRAEKISYMFNNSCTVPIFQSKQLTDEQMKGIFF